MSRQMEFFVYVISVFTLGTAICGSQSPQTPLHSGNVFPALTAETLTGKIIELPAMTAGQPVVIVFSFSRTAGKDAQAWTEHLSKDSAHVQIYTIILLESVPRLFRRAALSGIKSGMPSSVQDHTVVLYKDEALWKQRLAVSDGDRAYLFVLGSDGQIRWTNSSAFADAPCERLRATVQMLEQGQLRR
jgi:hypothetical protein